MGRIITQDEKDMALQWGVEPLEIRAVRMSGEGAELSEDATEVMRHLLDEIRRVRMVNRGLVKLCAEHEGVNQELKTLTERMLKVSAL